MLTNCRGRVLRVKKEEPGKFSPGESAPFIEGQTKFSHQRVWNAVDDMKEKERNRLLNEINSCLQDIEKRLERIENLFRYKVFDAETGTSDK